MTKLTLKRCQKYKRLTVMLSTVKTEIITMTPALTATTFDPAGAPSTERGKMAAAVGLVVHIATWISVLAHSCFPYQICKWLRSGLGAKGM